MKNNSGIGKMILIIALAGILLIAGLAIMMIKPKGDKNKKAEKVPTIELALGEFVVNLADSGEIRYLKTNVVLEVEGMKAAGGEGGEGGADAKVRDAVIGVLSSKSFAEVSRPDGKDVLKKGIIKAVNERLEEGKVVEVYFSDFAMQ